MRIVVLCVVLAAGCSKKSETKNEPAKTEPAKPNEAPKPPEDKPADKPPEAKPAEAKPAPPTDAPKIDCAAIITPDDIAKACGGKKVDITPGKQEGTAALFTCQRTISEAGKKGPIGYLFVRGSGKPGDGEAMMNTEKTPAMKPLRGVGDEAYTSEQEQKALKTTDYDAGVRKGGYFFKISTSKSSMNKNPPCTLDQMAEVVRIASSRLP